MFEGGEIDGVDHVELVGGVEGSEGGFGVAESGGKGQSVEGSEEGEGLLGVSGGAG